MSKMKSIWLAVILFTLGAANAAGQAVQANATNPAVQAHIDAARAAAGTLWAPRLNTMCGLVKHPDRPPIDPSKLPQTPPEVPNWPEPPDKIFDNVYFVGSKGVSNFAIVTPDGIIITDGMWAYDMEKSVVGGLKTLGLDPNKIRYVIIPHGHADHYGGAQLLHDKFGAKIVVPRAEIPTIIDFQKIDTTPIPKNFDVLIGDGDTLTLGGETITFYEMPGHSPHGVVMSFPVTDGGKPHRMLIWAAGSSTPPTPEDLRVQVPALQRLIAQAKTTGMDALGENHGSHVLVEAMTADPSAGNKFLVGNDALVGYLTMRLECDQAGLAAKH